MVIRPLELTGKIRVKSFTKSALEFTVYKRCQEDKQGRFIFGNPETKDPKFNIAKLTVEIITCTMSVPNIKKMNVSPVPPLLGTESTL